MLPALLDAACDCGQCLCTILVTAAASAPSTLSMTLPSCSGALKVSGHRAQEPQHARSFLNSLHFQQRAATS